MFLRSVFALVFAAASTLSAQILTGTITGSVQDPGGLAIAAADVTVTSEATGRTRTLTTDDSGLFIFSSLEPGAYQMQITKSGFKQYRVANLALISGERLALGAVEMEIGATTESVTVRAQGTSVQTESAERSAVITSAQVDGLLIQGRNPTSLVSLLPGVVMSQETSSLDRDTIFSVQGNRRTANNITIDGIPTTDIDNGISQSAAESACFITA